jgi:diacylglycerol O-acyltransferase / wax synthase
VVSSPIPLNPPAWIDDDRFDLDHHVLRRAAPAPGDDRAVLDLAAQLVQEDFDPDRPLWQYIVVEGMAGGRAALLAKMHHTITDGVGGVRLSAMFIDLERNPKPRTGDAPPPSEEAEGDADRGGLIDLVGDAVRRPIDIGRSVVAGTIDGLRKPVETAQSLGRQIIVTDKARSPLWRGEASLERRFEVMSFDLDRAKAAAAKLGGTLNDLYVTGIAGGAGAYHRSRGHDVDELRMSMPVSTRKDRSAGGNAFAPTRVLVPCGAMDPSARFAEVARRLNEVKAERSLGLASSLAGLLTTLPTPLLVRLARNQVETVDFATSNVRGAPFELFIAGARVEANHPMGPTAGTAFNATLLSYLGRIDVGVNIDTGAVPDPEALRDCLEGGVNEVIAAGA